MVKGLMDQDKPADTTLTADDPALPALSSNMSQHYAYNISGARYQVGPIIGQRVLGILLYPIQAQTKRSSLYQTGQVRGGKA